MMTVVQTLANALASTGYQFAHFGWAHAPIGDYGVYAEDGEGTLFADGKHSEANLEGSVDYFTTDDSGASKTAIETALASTGLAWWVESIQYEYETGFIHYEWRWHE